MRQTDGRGLRGRPPGALVTLDFERDTPEFPEGMCGNLAFVEGPARQLLARPACTDLC
jgi:hypothetical protein